MIHALVAQVHLTMDITNEFTRTGKTVYAKKRYILLSILAAVSMFLLLSIIPIGRFNFRSVYYQITSLDSASLLTMGFFSIIFGILMSFNIYLLIITHEEKKQAVGGSVVSLFFSFIAGTFGSAVCPACVALLFGFLGFPAITFLLSYQKEFFVLSALIALTSIYLTSRAINRHGVCENCKH